jgi:hypothetical protein
MTLFEPEPNPRRRAAATVWFAAWVGVTGIAAFLRPDPHGHGTHQQLGFPPCPSVLMFDRPCPGCGLTTSWTALVHGDFATAFQAHALGPLLYLVFTVSAWLSLWATFKGMRLITDSPKVNRGLIAGLVVFLAFGAARMATSSKYAAPKERLMSKLLAHPEGAN